jgi:hypothetical protein
MFKIIKMSTEVKMLFLGILHVFFIIKLRYIYNYVHFVTRVIIINKYSLPLKEKS